MFVDSALNWSPHIDHICKQTYPKLRLLNGLSGFLCSDVLIKIYKATILPILDYACIVWMDCPKKLSNKLERLQNQTLRIIFCKNRGTCSQVLRDQVKILTVFNRRRLFRFITAFNIVNDINYPKQLQDKLIKCSRIYSHSLRGDSLLNVPNAKVGFGEKTFEFTAVRDWNSLPRDIRTITNLSTFKSKLPEFLLQEDNDQHKCSLA